MVAHAQFMLANTYDFEGHSFWTGDIDGEWSDDLKRAIFKIQSFLNEVYITEDGFVLRPDHDDNRKDLS